MQIEREDLFFSYAGNMWWMPQRGRQGTRETREKEKALGSYGQGSRGLQMTGERWKARSEVRVKGATHRHAG